MSTDNALIARIEEIFGRIEEKIKDDHSEVVKQTIESEIAKLDTQQNVREKLDMLEKTMHKANVALAEMDGRVDNLRTQMNGEIKLVYEVLKGLSEKIERIEKSTSKEENVKRTWRIALIAAVPGIASVVIMLVELIMGK